MQQGTKFSGRFEAFAAQISFDPSAPDSGSIIGTIETGSVNTRDHDRDASLLDRDWFDSSNYPESRFESESIEELEDGSFKAAGQLTLKGNTRPMDLRFTFDVADGSKARFTGTMKIDRFDFNVGEGWNDTSWVAQHVDVEVRLDLTK